MECVWKGYVFFTHTWICESGLGNLISQFRCEVVLKHNDMSKFKKMTFINQILLFIKVINENTVCKILNLSFDSVVSTSPNIFSTIN